MSEMTTETETGSDQSSAPVVPEGYVPLAEVEKAREESRRRYQGEFDRVKAELDRWKSTQSTPAPSTDAGQEGFDPAEFRRQLLSDVFGASQLSQVSEQLKAQFPHANPSLFTAERLATFGNAEALRLAAEDSHNRVAAILAADREAREAELREQLASGTAGSHGPAGNTPPPSGDPTLEQLSSMTLSEIDALEAANPGVVDRVMAQARAVA
jgi:hypothetical protein